MKIKQFFVDNKDKINIIFENVLAILIFIVIVFSVYACGFYQGSYLESSEESNKKELVNRKEANNSSNDFEFLIYSSNLGTSLVDSYFESDQGNLNIKFISDVYFIDNGISFNYDIRLTFPNGGIYFNSLENVIYYQNLETDLYSYNTDFSVSIYTSGYSLPYALEGSEGFEWQFDIEYEIEFIYGDYAYYDSFISTIDINIRYLIIDDIWLDTYDEWVLYLNSIRDTDSFETYNETYGFYLGFNPYYFYSQTYDEAFNIGFEEGQPKNIFYYNVEKDSPYLLVLDDVSYIRPDDYDENLLFKNNYLDLQYLRNLYFGQYSKFRIIFTDSIYSLKDLYLSLDNSSLNDYNILVNGKAYSINSSGTLNIPSSELLQLMEFDSSLLDSTRLINASPDYANGFNNGFNNGYENGYSNGYSEGETDQEDYYEDLIIPNIKTEYYDLGLAEGRAQSNAILKPFELMAKGVEPVILVLSSEIAPGITIGTIALIPLAVTMIVFLLKGLVL